MMMETTSSTDTEQAMLLGQIEADRHRIVPLRGAIYRETADGRIQIAKNDVEYKKGVQILKTGRNMNLFISIFYLL